MYRITLLWLLVAVRAFPNNALHGNDKEIDVGHKVTKLITISTMENKKFNVSADPNIAAVEEFFDNLLNGVKDQDTLVEEGRTFGVKRIQFMLLPMMYKMGVMMTLLAVLTVISLKGFTIGVILLILKLSSFLAKFHSSWHAHADHGQSWLPPQPVHVHVHNGAGIHSSHSQAYSGWDAASGPGEDEHYYYKG